jgi:hypothetical protein
MILVRTDHPCLGWDVTAGIRAIMGILRYVWSHFFKSPVRIRLDAHIRTIVVLTGGKVTEIYFLYLLTAIYFL